MKPEVDQTVRKALTPDHSCYVLITCGHPQEDGEMEVELSYQGDSTLAAFLLESAQGCLENGDLGQVKVE